MRVRVILAAALLFVATPAAAQDKAGAAADAKEGATALAQHKFLEAKERYLSAYAKSNDPKYLMSAAGVMQKASDPPGAANLFARVLREAPPNAPQRKAAQKELDALTPKLAELAIKADGATRVTLDGAPLPLPLPPSVYAAPGAHSVLATFEYGDRTSGVQPAAGTIVKVTLEAPPAPPPPPPPPVVVAPPPPPPVIEEKRKPLPPAVVFVGAGVTVVLGALTVVSAIDTNHQKSKFDSERSQENLDDGRSKEVRTNVLLGATAGVAVLTGVTALLLVDWKGKPKSVSFGVGPGSLLATSSF